MLKIIRTDSDNKDFVQLVKQLDADLAIRDGDDHAFYDQFNKIDKIKYVVLAYADNVAVACGAIKQLDDNSMEVKRMFTAPASRGRGIAGQLLDELEQWAAELGYNVCRLETGTRQPEAIALYKKQGYTVIENYGQYAGIDTSVCFEKQL